GVVHREVTRRSKRPTRMCVTRSASDASGWSSVSLYSDALETAPSEARVRVATARSGVDRIYRVVVRTSGALTLGLMALIGLFLVVRSWQALRVAGFSFFTRSRSEERRVGKELSIWWCRER